MLENLSWYWPLFTSCTSRECLPWTAFSLKLLSQFSHLNSWSTSSCFKISRTHDCRTYRKILVNTTGGSVAHQRCSLNKLIPAISTVNIIFLSSCCSNSSAFLHLKLPSHYDLCKYVCSTDSLLGGFGWFDIGAFVLTNLLFLWPHPCFLLLSHATFP